MILYDKDGNRYIASKCRRPRMSNINGRCWDYTQRAVDNTVYAFWFEQGRGSSFYFSYCNDCYRLRWVNLQARDAFDVGTFYTQLPTQQGPLMAKAGQ